MRVRRPCRVRYVGSPSGKSEFRSVGQERHAVDTGEVNWIAYKIESASTGNKQYTALWLDSRSRPLKCRGIVGRSVADRTEIEDAIHTRLQHGNLELLFRASAARRRNWYCAVAEAHSGKQAEDVATGPVNKRT